MNKKSLVKDIGNIVISRGISLFTSVLTGFLVPIILGVSGYGYYKIFTLYSAYTALLHFGFVDGIIMKFAGRNYDDLDKFEIRTYSIFFIIFQAIVSIIMVITCTVIVPHEYRFIAIMLGINLFSINLTTYFQFISQATKRFSEYSRRNVLLSICKMLLIIILILVFKTTGEYISYKIYLLSLIIIDAFLLGWYLATYREIVFGKRKNIFECRNEIKKLFLQGIVLTLAYQTSHLLFVLDRQFVSVLFDIETYSMYAFAYNIVGMFTTIISSLSVVMFPMLKSIKISHAISYYRDMLYVVASISSIAVSGYFLMIPIMQNILENFTTSLLYLNIVIPAIAINSCISVVGFTFYKVLDYNKRYLKYACIGLLTGITLNIILYILFKSCAAISWASVITNIIWFTIINNYLEKKHNIKWRGICIYILFNMSLFYFVSYKIESWIIGFIVYGTITIAVGFVLKRKYFKNIINE